MGPQHHLLRVLAKSGHILSGKEWHTMWPMARHGQALLQGWEAGLDSSKELLSSEILVSPPVLCMKERWRSQFVFLKCSLLTNQVGELAFLTLPTCRALGGQENSPG